MDYCPITAHPVMFCSLISDLLVPKLQMTKRFHFRVALL